MSIAERISQSEPVTYGGGRPALLIGGQQGSLDEVSEMLAGAGIRVAGRCGITQAAERLDMQASAGLIWLDCGNEWPGDDVIGRISRLAESGTAAVVEIGRGLIDATVAALPESGVQILVDAEPVERVTALSLALAAQMEPARVSDVGRDNAVRLRQLSDEVGRIAVSLARLSTVPEGADRPALAGRELAQVPQLEGEKVRAVIRARRLRARYFNEELFADPAWDMLLDLLQAEIAQHRVPVSSLCIAAAVPPTTALRWIKTMTDAGLFRRRADPHDGRRIFVELSPDASSAMRQYFAEAGEVAGL